MKRPLWVKSLPLQTAPAGAIALQLAYPANVGTLDAYGLITDGEPVDLPGAETAEEFLVPLTGDWYVPGLRSDHACRPGDLGFRVGPSGCYQPRGEGRAAAIVFRVRSAVVGYTPAAATRWFPHGDESTSVVKGNIRRVPVVQGLALTGGGFVDALLADVPARTGYPIHTHDFDSILVLLSGSLSGLGHQTEAPAVMFYPAGTPHAAAHTHAEPFRMVALEFHAPSRNPASPGTVGPA